MILDAGVAFWLEMKVRLTSGPDWC